MSATNTPESVPHSGDVPIPDELQRVGEVPKDVPEWGVFGWNVRAAAPGLDAGAVTAAARAKLGKGGLPHDPAAPVPPPCPTHASFWAMAVAALYDATVARRLGFKTKAPMPGNADHHINAEAILATAYALAIKVAHHSPPLPGYCPSPEQEQKRHPKTPPQPATAAKPSDSSRGEGKNTNSGYTFLLMVRRHDGAQWLEWVSSVHATEAGAEAEAAVKRAEHPEDLVTVERWAVRP